MNVILTGATGTLGSKVLYELLTLKFDEIDHVYLYVRKKNQMSPEARIQNLLENEFAPAALRERGAEVAKKVKVITEDEFLKPDTFLAPTAVNYFIHSAGYVNLSTDPAQETEIFKENFEFTKGIFNAFAPCITKFIYVSTAFAIGDQGGMVYNDYAKTAKHRNYYETAKHASEQFLIAAGKERNLPIQILRPSVLGGNVLDTPSFFISKYMVFYLFAKFFYNTNSKDAIRITADDTAGLNIIPTDYAAKVIVKVFQTDIEQLNIVHSKETKLTNGIAKILETVGFTNFKLTSEPIHLLQEYESKLEQFYYETIGIHLEPYMTSKPSQWDTELLESILPIPKYDLEEYLVSTIEFAKTKNFRSERW